jgi:hypothetical protein
MRQVMDQLCTLKTTGVCILLSSLDADFASYKVTIALKGSECDRSEKKNFSRNNFYHCMYEVRENVGQVRQYTE